jgi:hypothetical protein
MQLATVSGLGLGLSAANADVLRVAVVMADNQADYDNNVTLLPAFAELLKKAAGVKSVYVGMDPSKMSITTSSVWGSADDATKATSSDDWKAVAGKLKYKGYNAEVFEISQ